MVGEGFKYRRCERVRTMVETSARAAACPAVDTPVNTHADSVKRPCRRTGKHGQQGRRLTPHEHVDVCCSVNAFGAVQESGGCAAIAWRVGVGEAPAAVARYGPMSDAARAVAGGLRSRGDHLRCCGCVRTTRAHMKRPFASCARTASSRFFMAMAHSSQPSTGFASYSQASRVSHHGVVFDIRHAPIVSSAPECSRPASGARLFVHELCSPVCTRLCEPYRHSPSTSTCSVYVGMLSLLRVHSFRNPLSVVV